MRLSLPSPDRYVTNKGATYLVYTVGTWHSRVKYDKQHTGILYLSCSQSPSLVPQPQRHTRGANFLFTLPSTLQDLGQNSFDVRANDILPAPCKPSGPSGMQNTKNPSSVLITVNSCFLIISSKTCETGRAHGRYQPSVQGTTS